MTAKPTLALSTMIALLIATFSAANAEDDVEVRLGSLGHSLGLLQVDVAESLGWLNDDELSTNIIQFRSGRDCSMALRGGDLDAAILGIDHAITAQQEGTAVKQLMVLNRVPGWALVVATRHKEEIRGTADLAGRDVGVTSPGSATHILLNYLLTRHDVPADGYTPVKAGTNTLVDILKNGGIAAGMAVEPYATSMVLNGDAFVLVDFRSPESTREHLGSLYPMTSLLVRQDFIDRHPEAVQALTTRLVWACKWLQQATADDVLRLLPAEYISNPDAYRPSYANYKDVFSPDGEIDVSGIQAVVDAQVAFGKITSADQVRIEELYDITFWNTSSHTPVPASALATLDNQQERSVTRPSESYGRLLLFVCILVGVGIITWLLLRGQRHGSEYER